MMNQVISQQSFNRTYDGTFNQMRVIEKRDFQLVRYKQKDNDRVNSHHLRSEDSLENTPIDTEESGCKNSFCMDD